MGVGVGEGVLQWSFGGDWGFCSAAAVWTENMNSWLEGCGVKSDLVCLSRTNGVFNGAWHQDSPSTW